MNPRQAQLLRRFDPFIRGTLLDIGCRDRRLEAQLPAGTRYVGLDPIGDAHVRATGEALHLPFKDASFDTVLAVAVLEHVDNPHELLADAVRTSRQYVIGNLPNLYELTFRLRYLIGKPPNGKYGLPPERPTDRHKWLLSYSDARSFFASAAKRHGLKIVQESSSMRRWTLPFKPIRRKWPNAFVWEYWCVLEKPGGGSG